MPIYEYLCSECDDVLSFEYRMGKAPKKKKCAKCKRMCARYFGSMTICWGEDPTTYQGRKNIKAKAYKRDWL